MRKTIFIALFSTLFIACDPQTNCEIECGHFCGSICGEVGSEIGAFFGHVWDVLAGNCVEVCDVKLKFVGENGQPLTGVCNAQAGMLVNIKLPDGSTRTVINGMVHPNSSGETGLIPIDCIDMVDLPGVMIVQPVAGSASFFAKDPNCSDPFGCKFYVMSATAAELDFDKANCALVFRIKMVPIGSCMHCPC